MPRNRKLSINSSGHVFFTDKDEEKCDFQSSASSDEEEGEEEEEEEDKLSDKDTDSLFPEKKRNEAKKEGAEEEVENQHRKRQRLPNPPKLYSPPRFLHPQSCCPLPNAPLECNSTEVNWDLVLARNDMWFSSMDRQRQWLFWKVTHSHAIKIICESDPLSSMSYISLKHDAQFLERRIGSHMSYGSCFICDRPNQKCFLQDADAVPLAERMLASLRGLLLDIEKKYFKKTTRELGLLPARVFQFAR